MSEIDVNEYISHPVIRHGACLHIPLMKQSWYQLLNNYNICQISFSDGLLSTHGVSTCIDVWRPVLN